MTKAEALKALAGMGITGKMARFLLSDAEKHGCGAHLHAEVTYAPGIGYLIIDYPATGGGGIQVTPRGAGG